MHVNYNAAMLDEHVDGNYLFVIDDMHRQNLIKILLCVLALILSHIFVSAQDIQTTADFSVFTTAMQKQLDLVSAQSDNSRKPLVIRERVFRDFCSVIKTIGTETIPAYQDSAEKIIYYPKQSIFVHILCWPFDFNSELGNFAVGDWQDKQYFLKDDRQTLSIHRRSSDPNQPSDNTCDPLGTMESCDIAKKFTSVMHDILNDMFDIKQADIYGGLVADPNVDTKTRIDNFISRNFVWLELCPDKKCEYPKTKNRLQAYFKRGEWLLKSLTILNWPYINNQIPDPKNCSLPFTSEYKVFLCAYSQDVSSLALFVAAIQNEMFFYRLFMAWYMWWIQAERRLQPDQYRDTQVYEPKVIDIINKTQQQIARTQEAVDMSFKLLREMYATFPIHIWLLVYYEDLYRFRKELVKVVTPLYTLYDKLRNVQDANE
jgi:hypothetical protein